MISSTRNVSFAAAILILAAAAFAAPAVAAVYEVGPGKALEAISDVPWESLEAGDTVLINWRPEPYREKWVICRAGTEEAPITVRGVAGPDGRLPLIDGNGATYREVLDYWNGNRSIIKIGGARFPADMTPAWIIVENLELMSARPGYTSMVDKTEAEYVKSASAIYIEKGDRIVIRNVTMRDCGNGLFIASQTRDALVEGCYIWDNGIEESIYEHNSYTSARGLTLQYNHYGPLRKDCRGNNLKDRSAGHVVRYNWIEAGNRQLDLVESGLADDPRYRETFVYGNILIEHEGEGNPQMVHYGGDNNNPERYRKGTLYFYNNTCISTRTRRTTLLRLSTNEESCDMRNNIVYTTEPGNTFDLLDETGTLRMTNNWIKTGYLGLREDGSSGTIEDDGTTITGDEPGFVDFAAQDFRLDADSPCRGKAVVLHEAAKDHPVRFEYVKHQKSRPKAQADARNLGAY